MFFRLLAAILVLTSCTNRSASPQDTLTTVVANPVQSLNPLYGTDAATQRINELTHSALISINSELVPEPYLAEEMRVIDPITLEFKLRAGCRFPSGRALTSDDVKRSLDFFLDPANQSAFSETFKGITKFEKIDDLRFRFITDKPSPGLLTDLDLLKIMDLDGISPGSKVSHIPGAGPYRLTLLDTAQIQLERWEQPCLPSPPMAKIRIKVVRDDLSRYFKLKTGEIDLVLNEMNYRKVEAIEKDPSLPIKVLHADGISYSYLGLNLASENLRDLRVRKALALSLDLPALIHYKSRGMAKQASSVLAEQNYYANPNIKPIERNLDEARRLLGEAGFFDGSNNKPRLRLTLKTNTSGISVENARVLVAQAKDAGIDLIHQANDWGVFYNDVKTGNTEVYLLRWVGVTDPRLFHDVFHSKEIGRNNRTRYKNEELDKLLEKGESTLDKEERRRIYWRVQEMVAEDLPYIGLMHGKNVAVFREGVKGVTLHPAGKWHTLLKMSKE